MEFRNGVLLQLVEGIESTQNEVKRKMIEAGACNAVPKSPARLTRKNNALKFYSRWLCLARARIAKELGGMLA
jgi:hypothetical protein